MGSFQTTSPAVLFSQAFNFSKTLKTSMTNSTMLHYSKRRFNDEVLELQSKCFFSQATFQCIQHERVAVTSFLLSTHGSRSENYCR